MCDPKLVTADSIVIGEIDVVVVNSAKSEDVKILSESGLGFGAKIDYATGRLVIFYSPYRDIMSYPWNIKLNFGQGFGALSSWLIRGVSGHSIDKTTVKIFSDSNLQLK